MTQIEHTLRLIQDAGAKGIGSNQLRSFTKAVDIPKIVSVLRKRGYRIHSEDLSDGTVQYFYDLEKQWVVVREEKGEPVYGYVTRPATRHVEHKRKPIRYIFDDNTNTAYPVYE